MCEALNRYMKDTLLFVLEVVWSLFCRVWIYGLLIAVLVMQWFIVQDINELYKHIDILNLFYRSIDTTAVPVKI